MSELTDDDLVTAFAPFHGSTPPWLPCQATGSRHRPTYAEEFMLMSKDGNGTYWLKHRGTRNYLCVEPDGRVWVPIGPQGPEEFLGGFFGDNAWTMPTSRLDREGVRRVKRLAIEKTDDTSIQSWIWMDEEGTWERKIHELAAEAALSPKAASMTPAAVEDAIATFIMVRALEATLAHLQSQGVRHDV